MFIIITPTATRIARRPWCLTTHGPRACAPLRAAMAPPEECPADGPMGDEEGDTVPPDRARR